MERGLDETVCSRQGIGAVTEKAHYYVERANYGDAYLFILLIFQHAIISTSILQYCICNQ